MATRVVIAQNLNAAMQAFPEQEIANRVYLTESGRAFVCESLWDRLVQVILDFFCDYKVGRISQVFQASLLDYYTIKAAPLTAEFTQEERNALVAAQKTRLNFVVRLIQANGADFARLNPQNSSTQLALQRYIEQEAPAVVGNEANRDLDGLRGIVANLQGQIVDLKARNATLSASAAQLANGAIQAQNARGTHAGESAESLAKQLDEARSEIESLNEKLRREKARTTAPERVEADRARAAQEMQQKQQMAKLLATQAENAALRRKQPSIDPHTQYSPLPKK